MRLFSGLLTALAFAWAASAATVPPTKRAYIDMAMRGDGDPSRGREMFFNEQRAGCAKCHSLDQTSGKAGPNLAAVGEKLPRRELIRAVMEPSASIAIGYNATIIETKSGEDYQGIVKQATADATELVDANGATTRIANADIANQRVSELSLMPEGLESGMSLEEFSDLIAFLETLREPANAIASSLGNPARIPQAATPLGLRPFFGPNIRLNEPVWFGFLPGSTSRCLVLEHSGQIWLIERSPAGDTQTEFLDMRAQVRTGGATGLLGFAFHPKFLENHRYFIKYHVLDDRRITSVIAERRFNEAFNADSGAPARELLRIPGVTQDHHGGCIEFGPDGYLYIGAGDTGPQQDPQGHGQDMSTLLGKMLRIDVDRSENGRGYAIPIDNPFRTQAGARPEIWALGFREPWRFTFDLPTGDLWVGDVGQDRYEEVTIVRAGENHGWNVYEGFAPFSTRYRREGERYTSPILGYSHRHGVSVTGGYVYRGKKAPQLQGQYIFADFETRRIWALTQTNRTLASLVEIGRAPTRAVSFAQDSAGELYLVGFDAGVIYQLDLAPVDVTPLETRALAKTSEKEAVTWRYSLSRPGGDWFRSGFDDSKWQMAPGGFGTRGTPGAVVRSEWRGTDIWLRREFTVDPGVLTNGAPVLLRIHHDEDAEIYINGVEGARLDRWTQGYIDTPLSGAAIATLRTGTNTIAIHCRQVSGGQYIDAGLVQQVRSGRVAGLQKTP